MIEMNAIYTISEKLVTRTIEDELLIIPIEDGLTENQDDIFSLNDTGYSTWQLIDGKNSVNDIITALVNEYNAPVETIKQDVCTLLTELAAKNMIVKRSSTKD
jgi:hypothetical protein